MKLKVLIGVIGLSLATSAFAGKPGSGVGTINKIKTGDEKLNITHGPITGLMGAMTMDFNVMDPSMLSDVKEGDKIKFTVEETSGKFVITDIQVMGNGSVTADGHGHQH